MNSFFSITIAFTLCLHVHSLIDSQYRWNLIPKRMLKRICNLDDSIPLCAWKRHLPRNAKKISTKWEICRDHPELSLCRWNNGALVTTPPSFTTTLAENSAEAPPVDDSTIFVNQPDMMLSSKWSDKESVEENLKVELKRFDGQLREPSEDNLDEEFPNQNFDDSIMKVNDGIFSVQ